MDTTDRIMACEDGKLSAAQVATLFHDLVESGAILRMHGAYQRTATQLAQAGRLGFAPAPRRQPRTAPAMADAVASRIGEAGLDNELSAVLVLWAIGRPERAAHPPTACQTTSGGALLLAEPGSGNGHLQPVLGMLSLDDRVDRILAAIRATAAERDAVRADVDRVIRGKA